MRTTSSEFSIFSLPQVHSRSFKKFNLSNISRFWERWLLLYESNIYLGENQVNNSLERLTRSVQEVKNNLNLSKESTRLLWICSPDSMHTCSKFDFLWILSRYDKFDLSNLWQNSCKAIRTLSVHSLAKQFCSKTVAILSESACVTMVTSALALTCCNLVMKLQTCQTCLAELAASLQTCNARFAAS